MPRTILLFVSLSFIILISCQQSPDTPEIAVEWEHMTNFTGEPGVFESKFTFRHNGGKALDNKNWTLFFNIAPRPMVATPTPQPATIAHINGDWYKMSPSKDFALAAGESIEILYRGTEATIKETDRPLGLYFVYYDEAGNEEEIVEVADYQYVPFTRPEQIHRSAEDYDPIPTSAQLYRANEKLTKIPDKELSMIVPTPVSMEAKPGTISVDQAFSIYYEDGLENEATYLKEKLMEDAGLELTFTNVPADNQIQLKLGDVNIDGIDAEAYNLSISETGIAITGSDPAGVFYGVQSLRALIPIEVHKNMNGVIPLNATEISDGPRFGFRSLHLDLGRNFQTQETILKMLDVASYYKVNHFLFYMTEDEGWRLEIPGLPELTQVGAVRKHTDSYKNSVVHPAYGSGPFETNSDSQHGTGYISRKEFIELLRFAQKRHITVIPEVNFPGHARAAIKSMEYRYERLMEAGKPDEAEKYRLIDPDDTSEYLSAQAYKDNVVCVVRESAYTFYEKVVEEIIAMYDEAGVPITKFHMGGDEVPNGAWTGSPMVAEFMKEHPEIENTYQLHAYFVKRITDQLKDKGLEWHGWEEVTLAKLSDGSYVPNEDLRGQNLVPYIWNNLFFGYADIGYRLANAGYPVVLCNVSNFYFDLGYSKDPAEPGLYWAGFINANDNWNFAPFNMFTSTTTTSFGSDIRVLRTEKRGDKTVDIIEVTPGDYPLLELERLQPDARKNIIGVEAQLWSETIKGRDMLEYYYLPKLVGFAESAWTKMRPWEEMPDEEERLAAKDQGWNVFANQLANSELPRLSYTNNGYNYRVPPPGGIIEDGLFKANSEYPGLKIVYTLDGSDPDASSDVFNDPVKVDATATIKIMAIDAAGKTSRIMTVLDEAPSANSLSLN